MWRRVVTMGLLPATLLGCSWCSGFLGRAPLAAGGGAAPTPFPDTVLARLTVGYEAGGSLGFALRDTALEERLYRRAEGEARQLLWVARFASRWPLTEDQLDRWSAQVVGHLLDQLGPDLRLAGWQGLAANDLGDRRVAYRYWLALPDGRVVGEATTVVLAQGVEVWLLATAARATTLPIAATDFARLLLTPTAGERVTPGTERRTLTMADTPTPEPAVARCPPHYWLVELYPDGLERWRCYHCAAEQVRRSEWVEAPRH